MRNINSNLIMHNCGITSSEYSLAVWLIRVPCAQQSIFVNSMLSLRCPDRWRQKAFLKAFFAWATNSGMEPLWELLSDFCHQLSAFVDKSKKDDPRSGKMIPVVTKWVKIQGKRQILVLLRLLRLSPPKIAMNMKQSDFFSAERTTVKL